MSDVQKYANKSFFLDALVVHALDLDTETTTGEALNIAASGRDRVRRDYGLELQAATQLLRAHLEGLAVIFSKDDVGPDNSEIFGSLATACMAECWCFLDFTILRCLLSSMHIDSIWPIP
jgi:hypothetical protein